MYLCTMEIKHDYLINTLDTLCLTQIIWSVKKKQWGYESTLWKENAEKTHVWAKTADIINWEMWH